MQTQQTSKSKISDTFASRIGGDESKQLDHSDDASHVDGVAVLTLESRIGLCPCSRHLRQHDTVFRFLVRKDATVALPKSCHAFPQLRALQVIPLGNYKTLKIFPIKKGTSPWTFFHR